MRILLIEDDPSIAELVTILLTDAGYAVDRVADMREGARYLDAGKPEMIVLDVPLPRKHSIEWLAMCKRDPRFAGVPVVVLSSVGATPFRNTAAPAAIIEKPFDIDDLCGTVDRLARQHATYLHGVSA